MNTSINQAIQFPSFDSYTAVSFDIFDTSVFRLVFEPRDVFLLMEEELVSRYGHEFIGFYDNRFQAEFETVSKVWSRDRSLEVNLDDIYNTLFTLYPKFQPYGDELKETELRTERLVTVPNEQVLAYFKKAQAAGKKIVFISDVYLPKHHISNILEQCGYLIYDHLFVSSEIGTNKASGRLFDIVIQDLNIHASEILHIGDNQESDIRQATIRGIQTFKVPNPSHLLNISRYKDSKFSEYQFRKTVGESLCQGVQKNFLINGHQYFGTSDRSGYAIGYQILGPLLYGFSSWIIQHAHVKNIKNIYFIAREGWFLKQVFDVVNSALQSDIKSYYFYASRRALYFPLMEDPVGKFIFSFIISNTPKRLGRYLESINLELDDKTLEKFGLNRNDLVDLKNNQQDRSRVEALLNSESERLKQLASQEKSAYLEYLDQVDTLSIPNIAFVDSGWFGNGQRRLQRLISEKNPDVKIYGFYLGLHQDAKKNFNEQSMGHGYIYHFDDLDSDIERFLEVARILEVFLSAPSQSLKNMASKDGEIYPVFMRKNTDSSLHPTIQNMHKGALDFVQLFSKIQTQTIPTLPGYMAANLLTQLLNFPTEEEATAIGTLPYESSSVADDKEPQFAFPNISLTQFLKNPRSLFADFKSTNWRSAYYLNHSSLILRFILRYTQRYFLLQIPATNSAYRFLRRVSRKVKKIVSRSYSQS